MSFHWNKDRVRKSLRGERGATAVEAAIVTPVVLALFFGIIELGFLFKDYLATVGAVRAGVRIASANPRNSTFAQLAADRVAVTAAAMNRNDIQQMWVYKAGVGTDKPCVSGTALPSTTPCVAASNFSGCTVCVKFRWDEGTKKFVELTGGGNAWLASSQNACSSSSTAGPPDRIGVYILVKHDAFTGLVFSTVNLAEASIMSLEPITFQSACTP